MVSSYQAWKNEKYVPKDSTLQKILNYVKYTAESIHFYTLNSDVTDVVLVP